MNLQRLEVLDAVVRNDFNVSRAAKELRQSQPGLSKHLQILEDELGVPLFERKGRRLTGLSPPGREVYRIAQRMLHDRDILGQIAGGFREAQSGSLTIAATHTQARYLLPRVILEFRRRYPKVDLSLYQGSPSQVVAEALGKRADLCIATEGIEDEQDLVALPCYSWNRVVIAPPGHPIFEIKNLRLGDIVPYPIVTYTPSFAGRSQINAAFASQGLRPHVVLSAMDADIIKTYVRMGLGVGIVAQMAFSEETDLGLASRDASHLFASSTTYVGVARGAFLKGFIYSFLELLAPHLTQDVVASALQTGRVPP